VERKGKQKGFRERKKAVTKTEIQGYNRGTRRSDEATATRNLGQQEAELSVNQEF
jgi:hypothetical protein